MSGAGTADEAGIAAGGTEPAAGEAGTPGGAGTRQPSPHVRLTALAERLAAAGESTPVPCPDPVNAAMIRNWVQAIGDTDPRYLDGGLAPPAMIQVWSMPGMGERPAGSVAEEPLRLLDEAGYAGVVATNCEQTYHRYLRHGERLSSAMRMGEITGPKRTALGEGYFVTWHQRWYDADARPVADMLFRILKFRPAGGGGTTEGTAGGAAEGRAADRPAGRYPLRPATGPDTRFFWAGAEAGELRIQRCAECGRLRHPPGPMCPCCQAPRTAPDDLLAGRDYVVAAGRGEVFSHVVHHHPPVPGRRGPYVVALVELPEGVRVVGNVVGCAPGDVSIGMPVRVVYERVDDDLVLPQWTPDGEPPGAGPGTAAAGPPVLEVPLTPTTVIATALATRDFTPVHHDPARARAQGAKDIFLNILTTMGLVQRYVTGWAGPDAEVLAIAVRLGVPAYAGDTLTLTGRVADPAAEEVTVEVRGTVEGGDHVTGTVRLRRPAGPAKGAAVGPAAGPAEGREPR